MSMKLSRLFTTASCKGTCGYLNSQKKYEIIRTLIYFTISLCLFAAGWITTGEKLNLLTVVAILGCLPASKSAVQMIMFLRYKSLSDKVCNVLSEYDASLPVLYDLVFTSYEKNYSIGHMAVRGLTIIGYSENTNFPEKEFQDHITQILKNEHIKGASVKIFTDLNKYQSRLNQITQLEPDDALSAQICDVFISVSL